MCGSENIFGWYYERIIYFYLLIGTSASMSVGVNALRVRLFLDHGGSDLVLLHLGLAPLQVGVVEALLVRVALVAALVRAPPVLPAALVERHQEVGARIAEGKWDLCRPDGLNVLIVLGLGLRIGVMVSSSHCVASSCVLWG